MVLDPASTTLNLLRPSCIDPRLPEEVILNGTFDYNNNPVSSSGIKVVVHKQPNNQEAWYPRGADIWYIWIAP